MALSLYKSKKSTQYATEVISKQFNISHRQAYRYVKKALESESEQILPEEKIVFTVRLPKRLVLTLRNYAKKKGQQLSILLSQILEDYLNSMDKNAKEITE